MTRRFRKPKAKDGELLVKYGSDYGDLDLYYCYPDNDCHMRADSRLLGEAIEGLKIHDNKNLRELLTERGYDITTFKLTVRKREPQDR